MQPANVKQERLIKRICAWCGKDLGEKWGMVDQDGVITHGICEDCQETLEFNHASIQDFLDKLTQPVLVVDENAVVLTANKKARWLLRKGLPEIKGYRGGDVLECIYAKLPGGCGQTEHCTGCAIRGSVTDTFATGKCIEKRTAYKKIQTPHGVRDMRVDISTEKVGDIVLLRIDELSPSKT